MIWDVIVIGGGPAGLMAAYSAREAGAQVLLLEKNRVLGRKLRITGKGRCNVTNNSTPREVMDQVNGEKRFLYRALNAFSPADVIAFFEEHGLPLKTERGRRVFPVSDRAADVAELMKKLCLNSGVTIRQGAVTAIKADNRRVTGVLTAEKTFSCRSCIVCTGGLSYPLTGSTGDGYVFAEKAGHTVSERRPSLVPLKSDDPCCAQLQGLSLRNVELSLYEDEQIVYKQFGEMLFTHDGISGPLVLSASARLSRSDTVKRSVRIDLKPALDEQVLDARILRDFKKYANRHIQNAMFDLLPHSLIPVVLEKAGIDPELPVNTLRRDQRRSLLQVLKAFPLSISGTGSMDEAIVTSGGVRVQEIDAKTMQSKLVSGLFFAGEVLDLDAFTGGYNLQIAWSTGRLAGLSAGDYAAEQQSDSTFS